MRAGKPDSFDDLESVTMIYSPASGWNLFASGSECGTLTFPSLFPDPMEAIINLASVLQVNAVGVTPQMEGASDEAVTAGEAVQKPSRAKEARRPRPAKPQSGARPKR